jgi:hypothetical protein
MRIYYAPGTDPTLQDSPAGLAKLRAALVELIESPKERATFDAVVAGSPAPYQELLNGLRVVRGGESRLSISDDRWLELEASSKSIGEFLLMLSPGGTGGHRHWYSMPVSLIVETCEDEI